MHGPSRLACSMLFSDSVSLVGILGVDFLSVQHSHASYLVVVSRALLQSLGVGVACLASILCRKVCLGSISAVLLRGSVYLVVVYLEACGLLPADLDALLRFCGRCLDRRGLYACFDSVSLAFSCAAMTPSASSAVMMA